MKGEDEDNDNMQIDSGVYLISSVTKMNEIRLMMQQAEEQVNDEINRVLKNYIRQFSS
jgi:hypothetical protein